MDFLEIEFEISYINLTMSSSFEAPKNAVYIILGEIQALTSSRKNLARWSGNHSYEVRTTESERQHLLFFGQESPELSPFQKLKTILTSVSGKSAVRNKLQTIFSLDLQDIDSNTFLTPFLDIIRSDETSGPITCLALNAVNKFLAYGLIGKEIIRVSS